MSGNPGGLNGSTQHFRGVYSQAFDATISGDCENEPLLCQNGPMDRGERSPLLFTAIIIFFCAFQAGGGHPATSKQGSPSIEGNVYYENGNPANGATVYVVPADRGFDLSFPRAKTDSTGHFVISHLWLGKFAIGAEKLDEGYPRMVDAFYNRFEFQTVTLTKRRPEVGGVNVRLGAKAGVLVGTVVDSTTGAPLNPVVEFRWVSDPNIFLTGRDLENSGLHELVPSDRDLTMKVWDSGYKCWYYPGTSDKSESKPVRLKPGEEEKLDIRLERVTDSNEAQCRSDIIPH